MAHAAKRSTDVWETTWNWILRSMPLIHFCGCQSTSAKGGKTTSPVGKQTDRFAW